MSSYLPPHLRKNRTVAVEKVDTSTTLLNESLLNITNSFLARPYERQTFHVVSLGCHKANELLQHFATVTKGNESFRIVPVNLDHPEHNESIEQILRIVRIPTLSAKRLQRRLSVVDLSETVEPPTEILYLTANLDTFLSLPGDLLGLIKMLFVHRRSFLMLSLEVKYPYITVDELVRRFLHHLPSCIPYNTDVLMVAEGYEKFQLHRYDSVDNELQKLKDSMKKNELANKQSKQVKFI